MDPIRRREEVTRGEIDASFEQICAAIDTASTRGDEGITLTGGEVTIRRDFCDLVHHGLSRGLSITIQTNGRRLACVVNEEFFKGITDRTYLTFVVALHGSNAVVHDSITRREGSFEETLSGIKHVREQGFKVWGKVVLSRLNMEDAIETLRLFATMGVQNITMAFPHAEDFDEDVFREVVPRYSDLSRLLGKLAEPLSIGVVLEHLDLETIPYCVMPTQTLWRSSMDIDFALAKLRGEGTTIRMAIDDRLIDWTTTRPAIKTKSSVCVRCLMDRLCEGPWAEYVHHFGDDELRPIDDRRMVEAFLETL
jgi:hypothetical protein